MYRYISKDELINVMKISSSRRDVIRNLKLPLSGTANKFIKELINTYGICEKEYYVFSKKNCLINQYSKNQIQKILNESSTYKEALEKMGYENAVGSSYRTLKEFIKVNNLDTTHMSHRAAISFRPNTDEDVFCENSKVTQSCLRNRVLKDSLIPYVCAICGQPPEWNGKPLTLTLDHKNGNRNDNRLNNLQFVCPHCDQQQSTFCSKNKQRYYNL